MDRLLQYLEANEWLVPLTVIVSLGFCVMLEALIPLFRGRDHKIEHYGINTVFLLSTVLVSTPLIALHGLVFIWQAESEVGLLYTLDLPIWMSLLLSILVLDLIGHAFSHLGPWLDHRSVS